MINSSIKLTGMYPYFDTQPDQRGIQPTPDVSQP